MSLPNRETERKPTIRRGFLLGIVSVLIALLLGFGIFVAGQHSVTCLDPTFGHQSSAVGAERYIAEITDFYKCIISIQFAVIGVVLAVAFVYVHTVSKQQARDMATEALDSVSFQRDIDHKFKELDTKLRQSVRNHWNQAKSSYLEKIRVTLDTLRERVDFVEQVMNDNTSPNDKTGLTLQEPRAKDAE